MNPFPLGGNIIPFDKEHPEKERNPGYQVFIPDPCWQRLPFLLFHIFRPIIFWIIQNKYLKIFLVLYYKVLVTKCTKYSQRTYVVHFVDPVVGFVTLTR